MPEDAEKYRRKQMAQKQASLNNGSALTGFSAPIAQNNQLRSAGDIKVQQTTKMKALFLFMMKKKKKCEKIILGILITILL